jgi:GNAT superfamily N-acetyltransferase
MCDHVFGDGGMDNAALYMTPPEHERHCERVASRPFEHCIGKVVSCCIERTAMHSRPMVRAVKLDDLDVLVRHRRGMWTDMRLFTEAQLNAADPVYRRWARARLKSGDLVGWLVEVKGEAVASACVWNQPIQPRPGWPSGRQPYLLSMYTEPRYRGRGFAKRIVRAATAWARKQGYPRFTLHASTMGRRVYEPLGWERTWEMKIDL